MAETEASSTRLARGLSTSSYPFFRSIYNRIAHDSEEVSLRYVSHGQRGDLLDVIRRDRAKDRAVGYSLHGVHRDDLEMLIDGYPMKLEAQPGTEQNFRSGAEVSSVQLPPADGEPRHTVAVARRHLRQTRLAARRADSRFGSRRGLRTDFHYRHE